MALNEQDLGEMYIRCFVTQEIEDNKFARVENRSLFGFGKM